MIINRDKILDELYKFASEGSGMVVGKPGIGKSYLLKKLQENCSSKEIICLMVRIDRAYDSTDEAIQTELELEENWIDTLKQVELVNGEKAILIFDAFDAARDENKRNGFLTQIKRAKALLQDKWNIIVSVRTYDAAKSKELEKIFHTSAHIYAARKKYITELTAEELKQAFGLNPKLEAFYTQSSSELREVLHVPFFLKILEDIVETPSHEKNLEMRNFKSEIQLLDAYWRIKVIDTDNHIEKERLLTELTQAMVEERLLNYPKSDFFGILPPSRVSIFNYLRSENILDEVSSKGSRIAFSHNILFDYATSCYCIPNQYEPLLKFINDDKSRPFFLRPSFIYFFTSLWYEERDQFWKLYKLLGQNEQKEIKLFIRLIINGTIAAEYLTFEELSTVFEEEKGEVNHNPINNLLQSIQFIRRKTASKDIQLLKNLSNQLQDRFLFEFAFLLNRAISEPDGSLNADNGYAARKFLSYILDNRTSTKPYLDRVGATRGINLVAKTLGTEKTESATLLRRIFPIIQEPNFEILYFTYLSEDIKYILPYDPKFVSDLYYLIFNHTEKSEDKTNLGGVVLTLTSNRRQDFEMCYYRLQKFFVEFLAADPILATTTGISIVNKYILEKKVRVDINQIIPFSYKGKEAMIIPDYSAIWGNHTLTNRYEEIAQHVMDYIGNLLIENQADKAKEVVEAYIFQSQVGFLWKLLFRLAAKYPEQLVEDIYPLMLVPQLIGTSETRFEVNEFLRVSGKLFSDLQIEQLEKVVFEAFTTSHDYLKQGILSMLPASRLQLEASRMFMSTRETIPNEPIYKSTSSITRYSTDEWLSDQGVDMTIPQNAHLSERITTLEQFNSLYLNSDPEYSREKHYLEIAITAFNAANGIETIQQALMDSLLTAVSKTAAIFARVCKDIDKDNFIELKKIIAYSFRYNCRYEDENDDNSGVSAYSPTPKIESSAALISMYVHDNDEMIFELVKEALAHKNGIVRLHVVRELPLLFQDHYDKYNEIIFERLELETDSFVYAVLISSIYIRRERLVEDGRRIIKLANEKTEFLSTKTEFAEAYAEFLLSLLANEDLPEALYALQDGYKHHEFCTTVIFKLFKLIPTSLPRYVFQENVERYRINISLVAHYLNKMRGQIESGADSFDFEAEKNKEALQLINEIVMRVYFALETKLRAGRNPEQEADEENRKDLYFLVKPILERIIDISGTITTKGLIIGNTAHYFIQCLNSVLEFDPRDILKMMASITTYSLQAGYTFDSFAINEIVSLTEQLLADHRQLLLEDTSFQNLLSILDIYINSGWVEALDLLWKLDEIFK